MDRRTSLRTLAATAAGLVSLPSWANQWTLKDVSPVTSWSPIDQQQTLASIADTIIPAGDAIGALSVGVDKFLIKLLENCYETDVRDNVKKQIAVLDAMAVSNGQGNFASCDQKSRLAMLQKFSDSTTKEERDFFDLMKGETIRGFNTSREVMVGYLKYKMVPGHYYGCVDVTT